jgi:hypothetical protein
MAVVGAGLFALARGRMPRLSPEPVFHDSVLCWPAELDSGVLQLAIIRDSTLNATNEFRIFGESFESVAARTISSSQLNQ